MLVLWISVGWMAVAVVTAVLFAAVGRSALREDEALGYTESEPPAVQLDADDEPTSSTAASA